MYNILMNKAINLNEKLKAKYKEETQELSARKNMWFSIWVGITAVLFIVLLLGGAMGFAIVGFNMALATPTTVWAEAKRGLILGSIVFLAWLLIWLIGFKVFKLFKKEGKNENNETNI